MRLISVFSLSSVFMSYIFSFLLTVCSNKRKESERDREREGGRKKKIMDRLSNDTSIPHKILLKYSK